MFARLPRIWHWTTLLFIVGLSLPSGCQKDAPTNPTPDAGLRIGSVEVERSSLAAGDSTGITVQVVTGAAPGTPAAGAAVTFQEFSPLAAGTFSTTEALCDDAGRAVVTYRPPTAQSGTVTLKVKAGSDIEYVSLQVGSSSVAGTTLTFTTATGQTSIADDAATTLTVKLNCEAGVARIAREREPVRHATRDAPALRARLHRGGSRRLGGRAQTLGRARDEQHRAIAGATTGLVCRSSGSGACSSASLAARMRQATAATRRDPPSACLRRRETGRLRARWRGS